MKGIRTRVMTVTCPECQDEIYSRHRHDYHFCTCGNLMVDGGFDYLRFGAKDLSTVIKRIRYINATKDAIMNDKYLYPPKAKFGWILKERLHDK